MKKLRLLFMAFFSLLLILGANAQQDTIKHLIFSERRGSDPFNLYIEIANVGTETIDLSKVTMANPRGKIFTKDENGQWRLNSAPTAGLQKRLWGTLAPGETFVVMNVSDRLAPNQSWPDHRLDLMHMADWINHSSNAFGWSDIVKPEWEMWGFDSTDVTGGMFWDWGAQPYVLFNHLDNGDSIMIDQVNLNFNESNAAITLYDDVAGVAEATRYRTLVRKANITTGNMDWVNSAGTTTEDSEWILLPNQPQDYRRSYTTVKTHGDFHINVTSSVVDINIPAATMTVPWGIYREDSILSKLNIGPGMAWQFIRDDEFQDSTHTIIQNGDILSLYAAGVVLEQKDFVLSVAPPATDQANVYPLLNKLVGGSWWLNPANSNFEWNPNDRWEQLFYVTDGAPVIDTIGDVKYATRVDTLFKYLEKAPNANWEIVWIDGVERADLKYGDILKVTAENGTTVKEYFIDVQDYVKSNNVEVAAITWPDKDDYIENWKGDTIPEFNSGKTLYTITLPYGTKNVPALVAHPADLNCKVTTKRAVSLNGSLEDRSTVFTVTSESGLATKVYTVIFIVDKDPSKVQIYKGTPFFSEVAHQQRSTMQYIEIANPGNVPMDLSEYMVMRSVATTPGDALAELLSNPLTVTDVDFKNRYRSYVPGFKFHEDTASWLLEPGILSLDPNVDPVVEPGGVFVISASWADRAQYYSERLLQVIDKRWDETALTGNLTALGVEAGQTPPAPGGRNAIWLLHIENDSVLEGTKAVGDPDDFTVVDVWGDPVADVTWSIAGRSIPAGYRGRIRVKPNVYTGSRTTIESSARFGTDADNSSYIVEQWAVEIVVDQDLIPELIGSHIMNPVTVYLSTVTSSVYLVSDGYGAGQSIQGDLASTTVEAFYGNLAKADTGQVFSVHSAVDGSVKAVTDPVAEHDTLLVTSADGLSITRYALINLPLDTNALLTTDDTNLTISVEGSAGTITGVEYGSPLKDLVAKLNVPSLALMNIINGKGELVPMQVLTSKNTKVNTLIGDDIYFEVIAQDKVTIITYKLAPAVLSSDAFVISSLYEVDQVNNVIAGLVDNTSVETFFANIEVVKGATFRLLTKLGHERTDGLVAYDDVLQVISEDGTVTRSYFITFENETNPDSNSAPQITLAFTEKTIDAPGTILVSATVSDDGLPIPVSLTSLWEVSSGTAANVTIENAEELSTNVTFSAKGDYSLSLTVNDGALTSKATMNITVGNVGFEDKLAPALNFYPNPAKDKLTLELSNMPSQKSVISIYNITGSIVYNNKLTSEKTEIDVSGLVSGLYFIKIDSGDRSFTQRVEIQK